MNYRNSLFSLLALAAIIHAAAADIALADDERFNRYSDRTASVHDSARPYQRQTPTASASRIVTRTDGFKDRSSHVRDSSRPYQQRQPMASAQTRIASRDALLNRFNERSTPVGDSQRPYQYGVYTAQR